MLAIALLAAVLNRPLEAYAFVSANDTFVENGSFDIDELTAIREAYGPNVFWFRSEGRAYIIRDAVVLKQISGLFEPQRDLGAQQAALGRKQAVLGRQQAELGAQQAEIGREQASASDEEQDNLTRKQNELSEQQNALSKKQESLGDFQRRLGEKQEELSRQIQEKLETLTKEWIRSGVARPLR
jgi:bla regulator protein blaR1